jgi:hypothetical protein
MPMKTWNVAAVGDVMIDREHPESSFSAYPRCYPKGAEPPCAGEATGRTLVWCAFAHVAGPRRAAA